MQPEPWKTELTPGRSVRDSGEPQSGCAGSGAGVGVESLELLDELELELLELVLDELGLLELVVELELLVLDVLLEVVSPEELEPLLEPEELDWFVSSGSTAGLTQPAMTSIPSTSKILFTINCGSQGY